MSDTGTSPLRTGGFRAFLATLFLGAYNDNLFKLLICFLVTRLPSSKDHARLYIPLAGAMLTLPFLVFSSWAGHVADHFNKKRVMVWVKVAEIVIMTAGFVAFWQQSPIALLVLLFLMGGQSAFFSPAKYGFLPETLGPRWLSRGNGQVQMWTFVAIILGAASAGGLAHIVGPGRWLGRFGADLHWASVVCVAVAVLGTIASLRITSTPPGREPRPNAGRGLPTIIRTLGEMGRHRILRRCLLGNAYFWFLAALFQLNILLYAQKEMGASELFIGILQATVALGIGFGSDLAGRISGDHIEFRLVPLGALGIALFSGVLVLVPGHPGLAMLALALLGASAGFFSLPLAAAIQRYSPTESRGRYLGTNNFVTFSAMTAAAGFLALVLLPPWVKPSHVFLLAALSAVGVVAAMFRRHPAFLSQFAMWLVPAPFYSLRVEGAENVPESGGALLVCNHISFADGPLVQTALRRPVRFLIHKSYYEQGFFHFFASRLGCIPVAAEDQPKELIASLRAATQAIRDGDIVCIFAESMISRRGVILPFRRGIELIMRRLDAPIIPMGLGGLWGDQASFRWGSPTRRGIRRMLNRPLRWPATARIGKPLPADTPSWAVREQVAELVLSADANHAGPSTPAALLLQRGKGRRRHNGEIPLDCAPRLRRRAASALACAHRLRDLLSDAPQVSLAPSLSPTDFVRACDVAALLAKTIADPDAPGIPQLGSTAMPLEVSFLRRLRASMALCFTSTARLLRHLGSATDEPGAAPPFARGRHGTCGTADALATVHALADGLCLMPEDRVGFVDPPPFAALMPLVCGCRLVAPADAHILCGTADELRNVSTGRKYRLVLALSRNPQESLAGLESHLDCPVLRVTLHAETGLPVLSEWPDIADGLVEQPGRRDETHGSSPPRTVLVAVDRDGSPLPPETAGELRQFLVVAGRTMERSLGPGTIDGEGFVTLGSMGSGANLETG